MKLALRDIIITLAQAAGSENPVLLVGLRPYKEYVDGAPTDKVLGFAYHLIFPDNKYADATCKVAGLTPVITAEELEAMGGTCKVKPRGFEGRFYRSRSGEYEFTSTATSIEVLA